MTRQTFYYFITLIFIVTSGFNAPAFSKNTTRNNNSHQQQFFNFLLPQIEAANAEILKQRKKLLALESKQQKKHAFSKKETAWLTELAKSYKVSQPDFNQPKTWNELKLKVDVIPPSLALAQAANESGWGKSRFALQGNNYFGQWCYQPGCGIIPKNRSKNAKYEVKKFPSVGESVRSYMRNLNSHHAYADLRNLRYKERHANKEPQGLTLASGLTAYAGTGQRYTTDISRLIQRYNLHEFDTRIG